MIRISVLLVVLVLAACGGEADRSDTSIGGGSESGLTAAELENGIGPISAVSLDEIDPELAAKGEEVFTTKCSACHKMDERYVGPPLGDVLERRSPAFVMNMMLNPEEMLQRHPEVRDLLAQYMTPMPDQQLTEDDARAVVEYLRTAATDQ